MSGPSGCAIALLVLLQLVAGAIVYADDPQGLSDGQIIERAKSTWESGASTPALELLDQGIEANPEALPLHKLRGDILATSRASQEALQAYEAVLVRQRLRLVGLVLLVLGTGARHEVESFRGTTQWGRSGRAPASRRLRCRRAA